MPMQSAFHLKDMELRFITGQEFQGMLTSTKLSNVSSWLAINYTVAALLTASR